MHAPKQTIIEFSASFNLPPEVLAGIAWTEAGGDPEFIDPIMHDARSLLNPIGLADKPPELTSVGDVQIQVRHVAKFLGLDADKLSHGDRVGLIKFVENERNNLYIVARYISHSLKQIYPNYTINDIGDNEIVMIEYMYNMGYPHPMIGPNKNLEEISQKGISRYGHDLLNKKAKMRSLLGLR